MGVLGEVRTAGWRREELGAGMGSPLAPSQAATCPSGSAAPRTRPPLCSVPQRKAAGPGAPCQSCHQTTTAREPSQDIHTQLEPDIRAFHI